MELAEILQKRLDAKKARNRKRQRVAIERISERELLFDGITYLQFCSNDYLGLSWQLAHPRDENGVYVSDLATPFGAGASPLVTGYGSTTEQLEKQIAEFCGTEAALFFNSGYAANIGAISALLSKSDVVYADALCHASMIDGARLAGCHIEFFEHNSLTDLRAKLQPKDSDAGLRWLMFESVYSMHGDLSPLEELMDIASEFSLATLVDEAHATGIYGDDGAGRIKTASLARPVDVHIGTCSKAMGCIGGYVAGSHALIEWLVNSARSYIYSTALPRSCILRCSESIHQITHMNEARQHLLTMGRALRSNLRALGFAADDADSPIIPIQIGDDAIALSRSENLKRQGIWVPAIRPPTVPRGQALLRVSLNAKHTMQDIDRLTSAIRQWQFQ